MKKRFFNKKLSLVVLFIAILSFGVTYCSPFEIEGNVGLVAPAIPTALEAKLVDETDAVGAFQNAHFVTATWKKVDSATSYTISISESENSVGLREQLISNSYDSEVDSGGQSWRCNNDKNGDGVVDAGDNYSIFVRIKASNSAGGESAWSTAVELPITNC